MHSQTLSREELQNIICYPTWSLLAQAVTQLWVVWLSAILLTCLHIASSLIMATLAEILMHNTWQLASAPPSHAWHPASSGLDLARCRRINNFTPKPNYMLELQFAQLPGRNENFRVTVTQYIFQCKKKYVTWQRTTHTHTQSYVVLA